MIRNRCATLLRVACLGILSAASLAGYLAASSYTFRLGFPLDDAWIHQTYACNLAARGEWAFIPGEASAGSTAPLWSFIMAAGHLNHWGPLFWAYLVGWLLLWMAACVGVWAFNGLCPTKPAYAAWAGSILALEWHLVWAAGSGMETLLAALLALGVLAWLVGGKVNWLALGALVGISAWVRPDGLTLLGPAVVVLGLSAAPLRKRLRGFINLMVGLGIIILPYLLFNHYLSGEWWPNTFYAKQAEYAVLQQQPLAIRFWAEFRVLLVGIGIMLLPGMGWFTWQAACRKNWPVLAGSAWVMGYLFIYAWRLPVTYQHGRYVIPAVPVFILWGLAGTVEWLQPNAEKTWVRITSRVWVGVSTVVLILFWVLGARAYAQDVAIIESEMVNAAKWVEQNTPKNVLVAAHDIGALGYFGNRPVLDLAGLVSPRVIPVIRDEKQLENILNENRAGYLVTFPGWYPYLVSRAALVYQTGGRFSPAAGGENMAVYRWYPH